MALGGPLPHAHTLPTSGLGALLRIGPQGSSCGSAWLHGPLPAHWPSHGRDVSAPAPPQPGGSARAPSAVPVPRLRVLQTRCVPARTEDMPEGPGLLGVRWGSQGPRGWGLGTVEGLQPCPHPSRASVPGTDVLMCCRPDTAWGGGVACGPLGGGPETWQV